MKQFIIFSATIILNLCYAQAQDPGAPAAGKPAESKWSGKDRSDFITECVNSAKTGMSIDSAKYYCYCMLAKVEEKYPDPKDVDELDEEALESPEWIKNIESCLGGYWPVSSRNEFLSSCIKTATPKIGALKANQYCECMMYRIEHMYPIFSDATKYMTKDKLSSPEWQRVIQSCQF